MWRIPYEEDGVHAGPDDSPESCLSGRSLLTLRNVILYRFNVKITQKHAFAALKTADSVLLFLQNK